jgi:hypothetical protein
MATGMYQTFGCPERFGQMMELREEETQEGSE